MRSQRYALFDAANFIRTSIISGERKREASRGLTDERRGRRGRYPSDDCVIGAAQRGAGEGGGNRGNSQVTIGLLSTEAPALRASPATDDPPLQFIVSEDWRCASRARCSRSGPRS